MDSDGIMVSNNHGWTADRIGTQLLGLALITILVLIVTWGYFFPMKRLNLLKVDKSTEVLGRDTIMNAVSKTIELDQVVDAIT